MSRVTFVRQLHLVGFTTDHRSLILSVRRGAKSGSYEIAIDDDLLEALDDARAWLEESADVAEDGSEPEAPDHVERPTSALTVREVQDRLRRGLTLEQVAAQAGVEASWVARFAAPVLAEQTEIIRNVRDTRYVKARLGPSSWPLGESVYRNLVDRNVTAPREVMDRAWRARQLADGRWLVSFRYSSRGRTLEPAWEYDPETGQVTARDRLATQLAHRPGPAPPTRAPSPATKGTKGKSTPASARLRPPSGGATSKQSGDRSASSSPARGSSGRMKAPERSAPE
jgi:transcriptional regulator with XRE-family HTH domain